MTWSPANISSPPVRDRILFAGLRACAVVAGGVIVLIVCFVLRESIPALRQIGITRLFTDASWHPDDGRYNLTPMIAATAGAAIGAVVIAAPLATLLAVFITHYAPRPVAWCLRRIIELLAGIPSVVYGLWGLVALVPWLAKLQPPGASLLAAVLVLALMILPTVAISAEAALRSVPAGTVRGAAALGLGRASIITRLCLPAAAPAIGVGVLLALGRAIGETMAVLMVAGNVVQFPRHPLEPVRTITANIALEMGYATADHRSILFASGLILICFIAVVVVVAEIGQRSRRGA